MEFPVIGRKEELALLNKVYHSPEAALVAITGRRRIGKTFLVNTYFQANMSFEMVGTQNASLASQLTNFADQLSIYAQQTIAPPKSWAEAFKLLRQHLQPMSANKKVVFFDELPWLAGPKSGFLAAFGYFWNSWACRQNIVVVICGSAASWMIQKVVNDTGGLHNRITKHIHLEPFTLAESEAFLQSRGVFYDRYQLTQIYMAMGGVPHYLKEIDPAQSATQNIDRICFAKNGLLRGEFDRLYVSLFAHAEHHIQVVRTLAQRKQGMTRGQLAEKGKLLNGGGLTKVLDELVISGFVSVQLPFGKIKKEQLYRLSDEYTLFYLQFIEPQAQQAGGLWQVLNQSPAYKTWAGYAFEGLCIKHIENIKKELGIAGIFTSVSSFYQKATEHTEGVQIDMVLDRNDHTINLFEIKYYSQPFELSKEYVEKLRQKMWRFRETTKTNKTTNWVFISTFGIANPQKGLGLLSHSLNMDALF